MENLHLHSAMIVLGVFSVIVLLIALRLWIILKRARLENKIQEVNTRLLRKDGIVSIYQAMKEVPASFIVPERYALQDYIKEKIIDHIALQNILGHIDDSDFSTAQIIAVRNTMTNYILRNISGEQFGRWYFSCLMSKYLNYEERYWKTMEFIINIFKNNAGPIYSKTDVGEAFIAYYDGNGQKDLYSSVSNAFVEFFNTDDLTDRNRVLAQAAQINFRENYSWMNK